MESNKLRLMMVSIGTGAHGSSPAVERTALEVEAPEGALPQASDTDPADSEGTQQACRGHRGTILKGGDGPLEVNLPDKDACLQQVDSALGRMQKVRAGTSGGGDNHQGS